MDTREIYENFEKLEKKTKNVNEVVLKMKEEITKVLEQNAELEIENEHLRDRLRLLESLREDKNDDYELSKPRQNLEKLYKEGFHICNEMYGSRRVNDEPCIFCQGVIYGERTN